MSGGSSPAPTTIVVPCFDEAQRLDPGGLRELAHRARAHVHLVDDGSTDGTGEILTALAHADPDTFTVSTLVPNRGKGEAVRLGLVAALGAGAEIVGYYDADLATPPGEMARLVDVLRSDDDVQAVLGSRVALLGAHIERSARRHYVGRLFATASSAILGMTVYDTQCGAKVLRAGPALRGALAEPFHSRWAFDVELLGRLRRGTADHPGIPVESLVEVPLAEWRDRSGSKLGLAEAVRAGLELARIGAALRVR